MKYYVVRKEFDGAKVYPHGFYRSPFHLVGGELLTLMEIDKLHVPDYMVNEIDIPKSRTFKQFDIRWQF